MATERVIEMREHQRRWAWFMAAGPLVFLAGTAAAAGGGVPAWERRLFRFINDRPDWLHSLLWPPQQLGAFVVVPLLALALWFWRKRRWAVAVLIIGVSKLIVERLVKRTVTRERPAVSIGPHINVRGDVPLRGESFVSGHAILIAALVGLLTPLLPQPWRAIAWLAAALGLIGRVYVGAHNPLDVVCGAALGFALAGAVATMLSARGAEAR
jgi:membrane-associated phospholipid phosphatase